MPEQWRVGRRNPHTVYRQHGDEPRGYEHADHDDSLGYFRHPEDARRAVDAVNAQAGPHEDGLSPWATYRFDPNVRVRGVQTYTGYEDRLHGEVPRRGKTIRLVETESGMTVDGIVTETDDDKQLIYVAVDWSRLTVPGATSPACDCPDTDGAVHLTLVSNPDRVGGQVTVGHTRWRVEAAAETIRARDSLDAWVPQWVSREQAELLERVVAVVDGEDAALRSAGADGGGEDDVAQCFPGVQLTRDSLRLHAEALTENLNVALREKRQARDDLARLASAAGVDPDAADPVGEIEQVIREGRECGCSTLLDAVNERFNAAQDDVEAVSAALARAGHRDRENGEALAERVARALRFERRLGAEEAAPEPEVVSEAEAAELPIGSLVRSEERPHWPERDRLRWRTDESEWHTLAGIPAELHGPHKYAVVYRAPAPAPAPLAAGEVVHDATDLDRRASVGTIVEDWGANVGRRIEASDGEALGWGIAGLEGTYQADEFAYPVTVVRVGTGGGETGE